MLIGYDVVCLIKKLFFFLDFTGKAKIDRTKIDRQQLAEGKSGGEQKLQPFFPCY
jgi:hypothetical protein